MGSVGFPDSRVAVALGREPRQQRLDGRSDVADEPEIQRMPLAQLRATDVDLDRGGVLGVELLVREVAAEYEQSICGIHGAVAGSEPEQTRHPHIERVVVFDEFLAAECVDDGCLQPFRKLNDFVMSTRTARAAKKCDLRRAIEKLRETLVTLFQTFAAVDLQKKLTGMMSYQYITGLRKCK